MPIPDNISRHDVLKAITRMTEEIVPPARRSDRYELSYDGGNYPPKYVISIANIFANNEELDPAPNNFNTYDAQKYLIALGFEILDKQTNELIQDNSNYEGFKIISLEVLENNYLGSNFYRFIESRDKAPEMYSTLLIGPNGTGKSNLFKIIIELFRELYSLKTTGKRLYKVSGKFSVKFSLNNDIYTYSNFKHYKIVDLSKGNNYYSYLLRNNRYHDITKLDFPLAIIANSIMLTDKYPLVGSDDSFPMYRYLGLRNKTQNASSQSYVRRTIDFIVQQQDSSAFRNGLVKIAEFLGLSEGIEVIYKTAYSTKFFNGTLEIEGMKLFFESIEDKYQENPSMAPFKLGAYQRLREEPGQLERLCEFNNQLHRTGRLIRNTNSPTQDLIYNIVLENDFQQLKTEALLLESLRLLGLIKAPEIRLKKNTAYALQESSSGEYHFLSSIVGLMATVKSNSLIFIDEPEISLHPNWQMKYLSFIRELFGDKEYRTCHLFVATHSHFLISDLPGHSSKIIGLKKTEGAIEITDLPPDIDTFGWSAEEILYTVFQVRSSRNFFVEYDLGRLITLINHGSNDFAEIERIIKKLSSIKLSSNDPLNILINSALKYIS